MIRGILIFITLNPEFKMKILLTNDDGIDAEGLQILYESTSAQIMKSI